MQYEELLEILDSEQASPDADPRIKRLLSPRPLEKPEDLHRIISTRYRYTGPGKWVKVLRQTTGE